MVEYIYKGFKIAYRISGQGEEQRYRADGTALCLIDHPHEFSKKKFHTEFITQEGAEAEIKKLLENYVDFELKSYYEMQTEKR